MSSYARPAFAITTALCAWLYGGTVLAAMGSLAPHDVEASANAIQQWLADQRTGCRALDPDYVAGDAVSWDGACVSGMASGTGTLTFFNSGRVIESVTGSFYEGALTPGHASAVWSSGDRYEGEQLAGQFDGYGKFASSKGDKVEGQWKSGALNGKANVVWANGDRYDGNWTNGKPEGEGLETWANGDRYQGLWHDGKPLGTQEKRDAGIISPVAGAAASPGTAVAARAAPSVSLPGTVTGTEPPAAQNVTKAYPLDDLLNQKLLAVDGSTLLLDPTEGGLTRTVTASGSPEQRLTFAFVSDRIGTVSDESSAVGVFRSDGNEIDIDYANGDTETMKRSSGAGLLIALHSHDGASACTAWYPPGHTFTLEEKRVAVQEYAKRLGVSDVSYPKKHRGQQPASQSCGGAYLANSASADSNFSPSPALKAGPSVAPVQSAQSPSPRPGAEAVRTAATGALQSIPVRDAPVHMIDAPNSQKADPALADTENSASGMTPAAFASSAPNPGAPDLGEPTNATDCLSVTSDGQYWGFRNRCTKAVQFAYCEMSNANPLTSCVRTSVSGSVAANGFSPLVNDESLSEQSVAHEFRWMACAGGAGEVVARLDSVEPPGGRCMRAISAVRSN